jgi:glycoprotein endo-alpha-1,2-mannosidase
MRFIFFIFISFVIISCHSEENKQTQKSLINTELNYKVHTFYYNWYGNPEYDGKYLHWAHDVLPHWSDTTWNNLPPLTGGDNIGANFYPQLGCYSSNDSSVISAHIKMIKQAGIGVLCLSWWGENSFEDKSVKLILDEADKEGIKVNFHLEPLKGRDANSTVEMMKYIVDNYGSHQAFYRDEGKPMFYVYDSYLTPKEEWASVFHKDSLNTIRGTKYDALVIGLWVNEKEEDFFIHSGFDGFYTYFASDGFTFGSSTTNWKYLSDWAMNNQKIFIPCVGPGYSDTRIRPWNAQNFKSRDNGKYYDNMFESAIEVHTDFIGITSFNEWHEGTQIEPAIEKHTIDFNYENYIPLKTDYYLSRTRYWTNKY